MIKVMPRITQERRTLQRERIIDAMLACMQREGLAATSMADVIAESGLSAGAIYGYFSSKDEILLAVAARIVQDRAEVIAAFCAESPVPSPAEALHRLLASLPPEALRGGAILQLWGESARREDLREINLAALTRLREGIAQYLAAFYAQEGWDVPEQRALRAVPAFMALAQGHLVQGALAGRYDEAGFIDAVRTLLGEAP